MQIEKLPQVFVVASELAAQVEFYEKGLGLELQFRDGERWVQFAAGGVSFALASAEESQGAPVGVAVPVFAVVDLDSALLELAGRGCDTRPVRDMGSHGRSALVCDPAGVHLMLFERARA